MRPLPLLALLLLGVAAATPTAQGLGVQTFYDAGVAWEVGDALGLYDPSTLGRCGATLQDFEVPLGLPGLYLLPPFRYFPAGPTVSLPPVDEDDPTDCAGLLPGSRLIADLTVHAGGRAWIGYSLETTEVANLATLDLDLQYCDAPGTSATGGLLPVFTGVWATCTTAWTTHSLSSCAAYALGDSISLAPFGGCAREVGAPLADHVTQVCMAMSVFDTITATSTVQADSDFYTVLADGSLASWATEPGAAPALFPNVSNVEDNQPAPSC